MAELKPCPLCGGVAEFRKEYIKTASGDRPFVCVRCHDCLSRTSLYGTSEDNMDEELGIVTVLWNRGCVADGK